MAGSLPVLRLDLAWKLEFLNKVSRFDLGAYGPKILGKRKNDVCADSYFFTFSTKKEDDEDELSLGHLSCYS